MATATDLADDVESPIVEPAEHYEVVDGRVVEEPPLGVYEGGIAGTLVESIGIFARSNRLGRVVPEVLFVIDAHRRLRRRPDVAFVSRERWPLNRPLTREAAWDVIPDIAVEITSPTDLIDDLMDKVDEYFAAGVRQVWVAFPKRRKLYLYTSATEVRILQIGDELDGGSILPGFKLSLAILFETEQDGPQPEA